MKRKAILSFSIFLLTIFMMQTTAFMLPSTEAEITTALSEETTFVDSMREFALVFDTKEAYDEFISESEYTHAFPYLKIVGVKDLLSNKIELASTVGLTRIFDVTDTVFHIDEIPNSGFDFSKSDDLRLTLTSADQINVTGLWSQGYDGTGTVVYDIDTGINQDHVDFAGRILPQSQSFVLEEYGYPADVISIQDVQSHGTHTAGIAAGAGAGNANYIGMAPNADILVGKVSDEREILSWAIFAALDYALEYEDTVGEIDVINMSLGAADAEGMDIEELLVELLWKEGMFVSSSAGNEGLGGFQTVGSSSSAPQVLSVASVTAAGARASTSSIGPQADTFPKPDVAAQGENVYSCSNIGTNQYVAKSGTSMAAPQLTGAIAVLIEALKTLGKAYDPGLTKAATMKSADPGIFSYLELGAGIPDMGNALQIILDAPTNATGYPVVLYAISEMPIDELSVVPQGFRHELFVESVSSTPWEDLTPVLTGNLSTIGSIDPTPYSEPWTKFYNFIINVADDATLGVYEGDIVFETSQGVQAMTHILIEVVEGKGKVYHAKQHTDRGDDGFYGQYHDMIYDLIQRGIAMNIYQSGEITGAELSGYDAIWLMDPVRYDYPNLVLPDQGAQNTDVITSKPLLDSEILAIQNFVAGGGGLFVDTLGNSGGSIEWLSESVVFGSNITMLNDLLDPFDIAMSDDLFSFTGTELASIVLNHRLTDGVSYIDHYGTTLTASGDAQYVAKWDGKGVAAMYENDQGGRVIVSTTNFIFDYIGYADAYKPGQTQNKIFANNIFDWLVAQEKIIVSDERDDTGVSFSITSLDPAATLTARLFITTPGSSPTMTLANLDEISPGEYTYRINFIYGEGIYEFQVESADDYFIGEYIYDSNPPVVDTGDWENNTKPGDDVSRMEFSVTDEVSDIKSISVTLNDENVDTTGTGKTRTFSFFVSSLIAGDNVLRIVAVDAAGNILDETYIIPTKGSGAPLSTIAVLLGLLSLAAVTTIIRRKRR